MMLVWLSRGEKNYDAIFATIHLLRRSRPMLEFLLLSGSTGHISKLDHFWRNATGLPNRVVPYGPPHMLNHVDYGLAVPGKYPLPDHVKALKTMGKEVIILPRDI